MRRLHAAGTLVLSVAVIGFALACRQQAPLDTRAADERAVREVDSATLKASQAKDLERNLSFYTDDASVFPPNAPIATGKEAIRAFLSQGFANPGFAIDWQPTKVEVSRGGDLAYTQGTYEFTMNDPKGKPITERGKYVNVWRKQPDGNWKMVADVWNSDHPLLAAPAPPQRRR